MNKVDMFGLEKLSVEHLQNLLYEKVKREYDEFIEDLKKLSLNKIIENSYKKVMLEDIVMSFEGERSYLNKEQLIALLKFEYPIYVCYEAWMNSDYSHMDMLCKSIRERVDEEI